MKNKFLLTFRFYFLGIGLAAFAIIVGLGGEIHGVRALDTSAGCLSTHSAFECSNANGY